MKIDNIKAALSSRVSSLNIIPQNIAPKVTTPIAPNPQPTPVAQVSDTKVAPTVKPTPIKDSTTPSETVPAATTPARKSSKKTEDIEVIVSKFLRPGVDYDLIPNCGRKPSLLKAGAEHLSQIFNFRTTSEVINRVIDLDKNLILYEVATTVYNSNGDTVAVGLGSCNTLERKFIKQGVAMSLNTVLKMARKRSYVDAILSATSASRIFTQDIEELVANSSADDNSDK